MIGQVNQGGGTAAATENKNNGGTAGNVRQCHLTMCYLMSVVANCWYRYFSQGFIKRIT
jgi:hypothetical protein